MDVTGQRGLQFQRKLHKENFKDEREYSGRVR